MNLKIFLFVPIFSILLCACGAQETPAPTERQPFPGDIIIAAVDTVLWSNSGETEYLGDIAKGTPATIEAESETGLFGENGYFRVTVKVVIFTTADASINTQTLTGWVNSEFFIP